MSQSGEVIDCKLEGELEDAWSSTSTGREGVHFVVNSPEISKPNASSLHQTAFPNWADIAKERSIIAKEMEKFIGAKIKRRAFGLTLKGILQSYDEECDLYEILYQDGKVVHLERNDFVITGFPPAPKRNVQRSAKKKKPYVALKIRAEPAGPVKSSKKKNPNPDVVPSSTSKATTSKKNRSPAVKASDYVPLAIRGKKKDDYYWF